MGQYAETSSSKQQSPDWPRLKPVAESERILSLDVLRGFAIFGIFWVNIALFSMPLAVAVLDIDLDAMSGADRVSWSVVKGLFEYKFVSLFSLLFGVGLVIQMQRARAKGQPFVPMYLRRTFLLMALGLVHGLLLWYGDILFIYSWVALVVILLRNLPAKVLVWIAVGLIMFSFFCVGGFGALGLVFEQPMPESTAEPDPQADSFDRFLTALNDPVMQQGPPGWVEAETIAYKEGPFLAALIMRSVTFGGMLLFVVLFGGFGPRVLAMFLLGAALMKLDFFSPRRRSWQRAFCWCGLPMGLAGETLVILMYQTAGGEPWMILIAECIHLLASLVLCLGYVGAVCLLVASGALNWLSHGFACVGRLALTNYIGQTVIATFFMYWWGLAWFGEISRTEQLGLVCAIFAGQMIASILWLKVFRIGPLEWLWRSLTYMRVQPILAR